MGGDDDQGLMQRFQERGDAASFELLFRRHRDGLFRFLLRLSGSPALAEEVSQHTWLHVLELAEAGRYRPRAPFRTLLFTLARHRYLDEHVRRAEAVRTEPLEEAAPEGAEPAAELEDPAERLHWGRLGARLGELLGALPPPQREVLGLWMEGLPLVEVAAITGAPWHTVVARKRYGLTKLRQLLGPAAEGGGT